VSEVQWRWRRFDDLTVHELYQVCALRQAIFVVEQDSPYLDADGRDPLADHLLGTRNGELVAYLRTLPAGVTEAGSVSLGRVVVRKEDRGTGLGRDLLQRAVDHLDTTRGTTPVRISAQCDAQPFYESFGFVPVGAPYIEDRIRHIAMVRL
jgi:ElaA protein